LSGLFHFWALTGAIAPSFHCGTHVHLR
jgi:hypothetical protein